MTRWWWGRVLHGRQSLIELQHAENIGTVAALQCHGQVARLTQGVVPLSRRPALAVPEGERRIMADSSLLPVFILALEKVASDLIGVSWRMVSGGDDLQKEVEELAASYASLRRSLEQGAAEDVIPPPGHETTQFLTDLLCEVENAVEASNRATPTCPSKRKQVM